MHSKNTSIECLSRAETIRFLAVVFAGGMITQAAAIHAGLRQGGGGWLLLTMWTPALAAFTTSRAARHMAWDSLKKLSVRWVALGLLLGWAPGLLKALILAAGGLGDWDSTHFELAPDGQSIQAIHHLGVVLGGGAQSFGLFALNLFLSIVLASAAVALAGAIGEELGWRAVLQPTFEKRFGPFAGTSFVGLIWAFWHLPVNLAGYNDPVHPFWTALLLFPIGIVAMSFGFAWLFRKSRSVWPVALAHGANNTIGTAFLVRAHDWPADTSAELLALLLVGGAFAWVTLRGTKRDELTFPTA